MGHMTVGQALTSSLIRYFNMNTHTTVGRTVIVFSMQKLEHNECVVTLYNVFTYFLDLEMQYVIKTQYDKYIYIITRVRG